MPVFDLDALLPEYKISSRSMRLFEGRRSNEITRGGDSIQSGGNPRLWAGSISIVPGDHAHGRRLAALAYQLVEAGSFILVRDYTYLRTDLTGATLTSVRADRTGMRITGLTAGRIIRAGDYISFLYGGMRAFHTITKDVTVTGGRIADILVQPSVREGFTVSTAVTLDNPKLLATVMPGSLDGGEAEGAVSNGLSFTWLQSLEVPT